MHPAAGPYSIGDSASPGPEALLDLLKWHLDRYDRLRASTASRASVVLSAGAILTTGDAIIFAQLIAGTGPDLAGWMRVVFGAGLIASAILVVAVLIRASGVLVTSKRSRTLFGQGGDLPPALLFNGPDTLSETANFPQFRMAVHAQSYEMMIESAQVELWFVIQQHRYRYANLHGAVRLLRLSALTFLLALTGLVIAFIIAT